LTDDQQWGKLAGAAALTALAILQKLTVIFVLVPALYVFRQAYGPHWLKRREPYLFLLLAGIPTLAWYAYAISIADRSVFTMQRDLFMHHLELWLQPRFVYDVLKALAVEAFSPLGLSVAVIGLVWPARNRANSIFRLWTISAGALLVLMPGVLPNNHYYLSLLLPGGAALAGLALARLANHKANNRRAYPILVLFLAAFTAGAIYNLRPLYHPDRAPHDLGLLL